MGGYPRSGGLLFRDEFHLRGEALSPGEEFHRGGYRPPLPSGGGLPVAPRLASSVPGLDLRAGDQTPRFTSRPYPTCRREDRAS